MSGKDFLELTKRIKPGDWVVLNKEEWKGINFNDKEIVYIKIIKILTAELPYHNRSSYLVGSIIIPPGTLYDYCGGAHFWGLSHFDIERLVTDPSEIAMLELAYG